MGIENFEVLNAKNVPIIRYGDTMINLNHVISAKITDAYSDEAERRCDCAIYIKSTLGAEKLEFRDEIEAKLAFEKIMGGKSAAPTSKELKENKTNHTAIQNEQAEWM